MFARVARGVGECRWRLIFARALRPHGPGREARVDRAAHHHRRAQRKARGGTISIYITHTCRMLLLFRLGRK